MHSPMEPSLPLLPGVQRRGLGIKATGNPPDCERRLWPCTVSHGPWGELGGAAAARGTRPRWGEATAVGRPDTGGLGAVPPDAMCVVGGLGLSLRGSPRGPRRWTPVPHTVRSRASSPAWARPPPASQPCPGVSVWLCFHPRRCCLLGPSAFSCWPQSEVRMLLPSLWGERDGAWVGLWVRPLETSSSQ